MPRVSAAARAHRVSRVLGTSYVSEAKAVIAVSRAGHSAVSATNAPNVCRCVSFRAHPCPTPLRKITRDR